MQLSPLSLVSRLFHHHRKTPCTHQIITPHSSLPRPLLITDLLSVFMDLPVLDISYQRNHIIYDLLCLAASTEHNVCEVHPSISASFLFMAEYIILSYYYSTPFPTPTPEHA